MTVYSNEKTFACSAEAEVKSYDDNYEYHFAIMGKGGEYYEDSNGWFREWSNYQLIVDSHLPFYIKRFDIPAYYYDHSNTRHDTTLTCYAVRPYVRRNGGLAVGTKNYRLRLFMDGHYRSNYPDDEYGTRDESMNFDGEIICPCDSSHKSKWASNDGTALHFYAWDQEEPELEFSDTESYVSLSWYDGTILQQYLDASPYEVKNKLTYIYYPLEMIIGETVYGEAPRTEVPFGNVEYYYNTPFYYGSAGFNFGNNPLFTGTYNEYRTYIEQNFRE